MKRIFAIGASSIPGEYLIPKLVPAIVARVPEIELRVEIANSKTIFERVRRGEYPLGIIGTRFDSPEVEYQALVAADRLVLIAPADHPLAGKRGLKPADLAGQAFITREKGSGTRATYETAFRMTGLALSDLNVVAEMGTAEGMVRAVASGAGIAMVSELGAQDAIRNGRVRVLDIPELIIARDFSIITRKGKEQTQDTREVIAVIRESMQ